MLCVHVFLRTFDVHAIGVALACLSTFVPSNTVEQVVPGRFLVWLIWIRDPPVQVEQVCHLPLAWCVSQRHLPNGSGILVHPPLSMPTLRRRGCLFFRQEGRSVVTSHAFSGVQATSFIQPILTKLALHLADVHSTLKYFVPADTGHQALHFGAC